MSEFTTFDKGLRKEQRILAFDKRLEKLAVGSVIGAVTVKLVTKSVGEKLHRKLRHMGVKDWKQIKKDANTPIWEYKSNNPVGKPMPKGHVPDPTIRW